MADTEIVLLSRRVEDGTYCSTPSLFHAFPRRETGRSVAWHSKVFSEYIGLTFTIKNLLQNINSTNEHKKFQKIEEKNKIKGIDIHPNQKPIADNNLASPNPMPSLFFNFLYPKIIIQIIKYPITPPIKEFT